MSAWVQGVLGFLPVLVFGVLLFLMVRRARDGVGTVPDKYDQLKKIADLKDRGALTDWEFEAEKRKILASDEGDKQLAKR